MSQAASNFVGKLALDEQEVNLIITAAKLNGRYDLVHIFDHYDFRSEISLTTQQASDLRVVCTNFLLENGLDEHDHTNSVGLILEDLIDRLQFDSSSSVKVRN